MKLTSQVLGTVALLLAQGKCQTTPGTSPSTDNHLSVAYGETELEANDLLPQACKLTPRCRTSSTAHHKHKWSKPHQMSG